MMMPLRSGASSLAFAFALALSLCQCPDGCAQGQPDPSEAIAKVAAGFQGTQVNIALYPKEHFVFDANDIDLKLKSPNPMVINGFSNVSVTSDGRNPNEVQQAYDKDATETANGRTFVYNKDNGDISPWVPQQPPQGPGPATPPPSVKLVFKDSDVLSASSLPFGRHVLHISFSLAERVDVDTYVVITLSYWNKDRGDSTILTHRVALGGHSSDLGALADVRVIIQAQANTGDVGAFGGLTCSLTNGSVFMTTQSFNFRWANKPFDTDSSITFTGGLALADDSVIADVKYSSVPTVFSYAGIPAVHYLQDIALLMRLVDPSDQAKMSRANGFLVGTLHEHKPFGPPDENGAEFYLRTGLLIQGTQRYGEAVHAVAEVRGADTRAIRAEIGDKGRILTDNFLSFEESKLGVNNNTLQNARRFYQQGVAALQRGSYEQALDDFTSGLRIATPVAVSPTVQAARPSNGEAGVSTLTRINVITDAVDPASVTRRAFGLFDANGNFVLSHFAQGITTDGQHSILTLAPIQPLTRNAHYFIRVTSALLGVGGIPFVPFESSFTPTEMPAPTPFAVVAIKPSGGAVVPVNTSVIVQFSAPVAQTSVTSATMGITGIPVTYAFSPDGTFVSMTPNTVLQPGTYVVYVQGIIDAAGDSLQSPVTTTFTTIQAVPVTTGTSPTNGATQVSTMGAMVMVNQPVNTATVTSATLTLSDPGPPNVPCALVQVGPSAVYMLPLTPLSANTPYAITVTTGLQTMNGDHLPANQTSDFWTR